MTTACVDWRGASREDTAALYAAEIRRWSDVLGWDTASSWTHIELGRRLGTVSGFVALDDGLAIAGWTFYLLHRNVLQIGGLTAASADVTAALLAGIFESDAAARARAVTFFAFTEAPGLTEALAAWGLTVVRYSYLTKALTEQSHEPTSGIRRFRASDDVAALLASTYPAIDEGRPFARHGTAEEWQEYVGQIVNASGCGTILPDACFVAPGDRDRLTGAILVTRLSETTAHVAQIAVAPAVQRRGLGRRLLGDACASARDAGCTRVTLLVDDRNVRARRLYADAGFVEVAGFVSAGSRQPVRFTSVAAAGAAVTRP